MAMREKLELHLTANTLKVLRLIDHALRSLEPGIGSADWTMAHIEVEDSEDGQWTGRVISVRGSVYVKRWRRIFKERLIHFRAYVPCIKKSRKEWVPVSLQLRTDHYVKSQMSWDIEPKWRAPGDYGKSWDLENYTYSARLDKFVPDRWRRFHCSEDELKLVSQGHTQ